MQKRKKRSQIAYKPYLLGLLTLLPFAILTGWYFYTDYVYKERIFPSIKIDGVPFGGNTKAEVETYWKTKSKFFESLQYTFTYDSKTATVSGHDLDISFDGALSGAQAYSIGRSGNVLSNIYYRFFTDSVNLPPTFRWDDDVLSQIIASFSAQFDIPAEDGLFQFENGKVTSFRPSKDGKNVNETHLREIFGQSLPLVSSGNLKHISLLVPVDIIRPNVTTTDANSFGIKELIGKGYSEFAGSIPGRIHNVALAAGRLNGVLIKPGESFSFNKTIGDISAATGYQSAYVIKDGRTVLGDGGGVCQVSTTLFRAALNAGLPIIERHEHSYRVHYYEEGGFKAGLDATVFDPTNDLKFVNDTPSYILIQTKTDLDHLSLTFELYGAGDGRKAEILNHKVWGISSPPPPLYQDDPTLPVGVVKQVDFEAWGAKASFQYKVTKNGETIIDQVIYSNFRPWQAVFLKGTKQ